MSGANTGALHRIEHYMMSGLDPHCHEHRPGRRIDIVSGGQKSVDGRLHYGERRDCGVVNIYAYAHVQAGLTANHPIPSLHFPIQPTHHNLDDGPDSMP